MFIKNKTLIATVAALAIAGPTAALAASNERPIEGVISSPQPVQFHSNYGMTPKAGAHAMRSVRPVEHVIANPAPKSSAAFSRSGRMVDHSLSNSTKPYEGTIAHPQPIGTRSNSY
ncbi:hypothetical protein [Breoghania sp. JC706]|uniref:hypothetical protein n=1 Tax=Breoghania sp. JC706 TaxID=3117732 RepID=UPI0030086E4F